jgi:hypothetical protein
MSNFQDQPFFDETQRLFRYVSEHNFDDLADLCDDDFGIVDLGPSGESVVIDDRAGWEIWFRTLFAKLEDMQAETDTEITDYHALKHETMGYSVVKFTQRLGVGGKDAFFHCIVTIIWKKTDKGWKESRWHTSLLSVDQPS